MSCLGFKGGIGTASRLTPSGHTVGVLLLSNFGARERLTVDGVPVGRLLPPFGDEPRDASGPAGSCIVVVVTDAPLDSAACARLARRAGPGAGQDRLHGAATAAARSSSPWPPGLRGPRPLTARTRRSAREGGGRADRDRRWTRSSPPSSRPPRRRSSTACWPRPPSPGRDGNTSYGLPAEQVREAAAGQRRPHVE